MWTSHLLMNSRKEFKFFCLHRKLSILAEKLPIISQSTLNFQSNDLSNIFIRSVKVKVRWWRISQYDVTKIEKIFQNFFLLFLVLFVSFIAFFLNTTSHIWKLTATHLFNFGIDLEPLCLLLFAEIGLKFLESYKHKLAESIFLANSTKKHPPILSFVIIQLNKSCKIIILRQHLRILQTKSSSLNSATISKRSLDH